MMILQPGLQFLLVRTPRFLLFTSLAVILTLRILGYIYEEGEHRRRHLVLVFIVIVSTYHSLRLFLAGLLKWRRLRSLGAQGVPLYSGRWPGNVDLLVKMFKSLANGYPHELVGDAVEELGMTFEMQLLGINVVCLSSCTQCSG